MTERSQVDEARVVRSRWWQRKRLWLVGLPALFLVGVVGLLAWDSNTEPPPVGAAPVMTSDDAAAEHGVATTGTAAAGVENENTVVTEVEDDVAPVETPPTRFTVDARSTDHWVLFDFETGAVIDGDLSAPDWDLAFRRTGLLTNSGISNPMGPGGAFDLGEVPLVDAVPPAAAEFAVDQLGGEEGDEPENPAAGNWYSYSFIDHTVSAKPNTYVVRTGDSHDALVQFESYYCPDEESACITFSYRLIPRVADASS